MYIPRCILPVFLVFFTGYLQASESVDSVRDWLIRSYPSGTNVGVIVKVGRTLYPEATLVAAENNSIELHAKGLNG